MSWLLRRKTIFDLHFDLTKKKYYLLLHKPRPNPSAFARHFEDKKCLDPLTKNHQGSSDFG